MSPALIFCLAILFVVILICGYNIFYLYRLYRKNDWVDDYEGSRHFGDGGTKE